MSWLERFFRYVMTWRKHRKVIKELNAMTDKELDDIGISRYDIEQLVWLSEDKEASGKGKK